MAFRKGQSGSPSTQFQKGQSGNPGGRPKSKPISEALRTLLELELRSYKKFRPKTQAQKIAKRMIDDASKGMSTAVREVLDRTEGKVPLPITGADGPLEMNVRIIHIGAGRPRSADGSRHRAPASTS